MRWLIKDTFNLSLAKRRHLTAATPTWKGDYMRDGIKCCNKPRQYLAIALFNNKILIGWAMFDFRLSGEHSVRTYIYVKTRYRRKGFGRKIFNKATEIATDLGRAVRVLPHDRTSRRFYKKLNITKEQIVRNYKL